MDLGHMWPQSQRLSAVAAPPGDGGAGELPEGSFEWFIWSPSVPPGKNGYTDVWALVIALAARSDLEIIRLENVDLIT